jgi:biopolymer transport protein ExbD
VSRRKHKKTSDGVEVPITPMLDMAFQLLTFFVLTYRPMPTEGQFLMNLLPAQPATAMNAEAPDQGNPSSELPASLRTLPTILRADPAGNLIQIRVGENDIPDDPDALEAELLKLFQDPDLPFDQTLIKVEPGLRYSELMKVINAFSNAFVRAKKEPKLSFAELGPDEGV